MPSPVATSPAGEARPLDAVRGELDRCNKCGFCQSACPTFRVTGFEWMVTRGRVALAQEVLAGTIAADDPDVVEAIDSCLVCGACLDACPPRIQIHDVVHAVRAERVARNGLPRLARLVLRGLLPRPGLLSLAASIGYLGEVLGLRRLAGGSGLLRGFPALQRAARVGPSLPGTTARRLIGQPRRPTQPRARVAYFISCTKEFVYPRAARATVDVLVANDVEVILPPAVCCGLPHASAGDLEGMRDLAHRNVRFLQGLDVDAIVCDEGSCAAHLHEYPKVLTGTADAEGARQVAAKLTDLSAFLDKLGARPMQRLEAKVTWHDPCSLRNFLGVTAAPRRLLQAVPGVTFVEPAESGTCCGGAGQFMLIQPQLSDTLLGIKIDAFAETRAEYLVTTSPACIMQLQRGIRERGLPMRVLYLSEFLALAYGLTNLPRPRPLVTPSRGRP